MRKKSQNVYHFKMFLAAVKSQNSIPNLEYIHVSFSSLIRGSSPLLDKKPTCFIINKFLDQFYIILFSIFKINLNVSIYNGFNAMSKHCKVVLEFEPDTKQGVYQS